MCVRSHTKIMFIEFGGEKKSVKTKKGNIFLLFKKNT